MIYISFCYPSRCVRLNSKLLPNYSCTKEVMRKEIDKAVEIFHRIALKSRLSGYDKVSDLQLNAFVSVLTELLLNRYKNNWYPMSPNRGSGYRCLRINGQCIDPTVVEGLKRAGISVKNINGTELTVWVDPGVVSVRIGEEGSIGSEVVDEEVFRKSVQSPPPRRPHASTSDDDACSSRSASPDHSPERPMSVSPPLNVAPPAQIHQPPPPPPLEYNPYSASSPQVSYPQRQHRRVTPPRMMGKGTTPSHPNSSQAGMSHGHIPATYAQPRNLFTQDNNYAQSQRDMSAMTNANYKVRQNVPIRSGLQDYYDIPISAMA